MNSIIRYFGGKNGMSKQILEYFPKKGSYNTYLEPFGGSFALALHNTNIPPIEIYNDLDKNVYSLFKVLTNDEMFSEFRSLCDKSLYIEEIRKDYLKDLKGQELDESKEGLILRAFKFLYVNRTSHNGMGGFSINTCIRRNMSKSCSDMLATIEGLPQLHDRLSKVIVTNQDGINLITKYSNREDTFIYADPPYHHSTRTSARYNVDMDNATQEKFIDECINAKCKILISGYDCEAYKRLEENGFKKITFIVHTMSGDHKTKKDKTECLWMNYDVSAEEDLFTEKQ